MWFFCDFMDHNSSINTKWREEVLIYVRISEGCELLLCNASTYDCSRSLLCFNFLSGESYRIVLRCNVDVFSTKAYVFLRHEIREIKGVRKAVLNFNITIS